jgi:hypothetical protein
MPVLPLTPHLKFYGGSKEALQRRNADYNSMATKVAGHVNSLIADNPDRSQMYTFATIARDLRLTVAQVREALPEGGFNGISFGVTEEDRAKLARFKSGTN